MGWMLAIVFGAAIVLFILSFIYTKKASNEELRAVEQFSLTILNDMNKLQEHVRNVELDTEIMAKEAGLEVGSTEKRRILRDMLDMYRRGYSFESIAEKKKLPEAEVKHRLAPYMNVEGVRRKVANDS
ncbi:hypothetical protein [Bacillus sp. FJAT-45350]|uniref:hypothetical protein n=1 Tax=Bacillus sp. FJAT-45350 TaxID=2011014 RepID=UPI00211C9489|nr:hypothetical protein [Bacillus sp. FJAT-45350]